MTADLKELEALQPQIATVTINNEIIEIKPFKFKQFFAALKHLSNMIADVNQYEDQTIQLIRLLGEHPDDVVGLMALATGKPAAFFDTLDTDAGLDIAIAVWNVNKDFFGQKIQPKLVSLGLLNSPEESKTLETQEATESNQVN